MSADSDINWPLARIVSDHPIRDARDLRFEFEGLAKTLEELARNPHNQTPFTVVVRGDWGRGKTTLLRSTEKRFEAEPSVGGERQVKTLWFNAWKYPSEETVLAGLLGALVDALQRGGQLDQLKLLAERHKGRLVGSVLKTLLPWLPELEDTSRLAKADEKRAFHDTFRQLFAQLLYVWHEPKGMLQDTEGRDVEGWLEEQQEERVLAIFLDDLDRCREERVLELLAAINLFLDLPGVCFFLGVDWSRLREILASSMPGREDAFLEKMVQVELELHEVSEDGARDYVGSLLLDNGFEWLAERDRDALATSFENRHPRHVKRVLNDLALRLAVLRNVEKLGTGEEQLAQESVVAWHLLREALPTEEFEQLRTRANLDAFLRKWSAFRDAASQDADVQGGLSERVAVLAQRGVLDAHVELLGRLNPTQRDLLIHLGSPSSTVRRPAPAGAGERRFDPLDLDGPAWVALDGGSFTMGASDLQDAKPHKAVVSPFRIARFPVTNRQYRAYVEQTDKQAPDHWQGGAIPQGKEDHPVVRVAWDDARAFCAWLTHQIRQRHGEGLEGEARLPTEAEWEFAARGAEGRAYPWGDDEPTPEHANYDDQVGDTSPVDGYPKGATPEGVHDLAGNVWEWCQDWYGESPEESPPDYSGPDSGGGRVLRGGAFDAHPRDVRSAYRYALPELRYVGVGFRVVWSSSGGQRA